VIDIQKLHEGTASGDGIAQAILGICYLHGFKVEVNYEEAFRLLSPLSQRSRAVTNLARMYAEGLGIPKDVNEAIRLYKNSAKSEFRAQLELGRIYSRGIGVPIDHKEALQWYSAAAMRDDNDYVDDPIIAALVGSGTSEEVQEAKAYVTNACAER
jgi:TPR repeat protein